MSEKKEKIPYIKLARKFFENPFWEEERKFSRAEAWLDILQMVNYKEKTFFINEKPYICKRGEACLSMSSWANRWKWSRKKVKIFFDYLIKNKTINYKTDNKTTHLKICNYESYNKQGTTNAQQTNNQRTTNEQPTPTTEERRERKESNNIINNIPFSQNQKTENNALLLGYVEQLINLYPRQGFNKQHARIAMIDKLQERFDKDGNDTEKTVFEYFKSKLEYLKEWCNAGNSKCCWNPQNYFGDRWFEYDVLPDYTEFANGGNKEVNQFDLLKQL